VTTCQNTLLLTPGVIALNLNIYVMYSINLLFFSEFDAHIIRLQVKDNTLFSKIAIKK